MTMLIGFCGRARAGKGMAADWLVRRHGYELVKFAAPLKDMLRVLGLTNAEIEGDLKEKPCALLGGKTPRWAMQALGTEYGRNLIDKDLWVRAWANRLVPYRLVTVDDVRFPNEEAALHTMGGLLIEVRRDGTDAPVNHESEQHVFSPDYVIENNGSLDDLYLQIENIHRRQIGTVWA